MEGWRVKGEGGEVGGGWTMDGWLVGFGLAARRGADMFW